MSESERQKAKEEAVLLALQNGVALVRRECTVYGMKIDGSTELISRSAAYENLWQDAKDALQNRFVGVHPLGLRPKVGLGVMVIKDGKVLMCKRKSSHGTGEWAWPGGHVEHVESFEQGSA